MSRWVMVLLAAFALAGCSDLLSDVSGEVQGQRAVVTRVIDGDTIDVKIGSEEFRVRYVGVNTPERDEVCYAEAVRANRALVGDKTVTLVKDVSDTDTYGRLLRYIYVGSTMVNESLARDGWAEAVKYSPDTRFYETFRGLENEAARAGRGCHPTGIFDDGSATR